MFFTVFNAKRNKTYISALVYILITFYLITTNGCQTTTAELYTNTDLKSMTVLEGISHIILKDGTYIDAEGKNVYYFKKYRDSLNVLVLVSETDKQVIENGKQITKTVKQESFIPLSKVQEVYVTRTELDAGNTILLTLGIIAGIAIVLFVIIAASLAAHPVHSNSCPYIYSFDGKKYIYDAEPLGGVICEGLARTDLSRLEHLSPSENKFKLFIRNENDEQQHLDEMKLVLVNHEKIESVTPDMDGKFYRYKNVTPPLSVTDENGNDITKYFASKDDYLWQTDMQSAAYSKEYRKHSLKFRFKKPEGVKNALLFFNGGISYWGSNMVKNTLSLRGNKIDDWYKELNKRDAELKNLHNYILGEELYYLKVNLLENGGSCVKAAIPGGGPKIDEDKVFSIPLENVSGDYIEFTLNPPQGYWKFEQVGLIYEYEQIEKENINVIESSYALDKSGKDITKELISTDKNYYEMSEVGNSCYLQFDVPSGFDKSTCEVFLKTNGWYEINLDKSKPEQTELISEIFNNPGKIIEYSMSLYRQKIKELTELENLKNRKN